MRALFAGVSGLRNHQTRMDVIGNNIANVNTVAFKASRVTFEEAFTQLVRGASRPSGSLGGVNPIQVGLGMSIASVDQNFSQGNLESTGKNTDLAIQGDAFFIASDGSARFYTRSGSFQLDADGRLVSPTNGYAVQGVMADSNGILPTGAPLDNMILPLGRKSPARATSQITLGGNLDPQQEPVGTVLRTANGIFAIERATSNGGAGFDVNGLHASGATNSQILGMSPDRTTLTIGDGTTTQTYTYVAQDAGVGDGAFNSLNGLIAEINADFAGQITATLNTTTGSLDFTANAAGVNVSISSSNAAFQGALATLNGALASGVTVNSDQFSHIAVSDDLMVDLRNGAGAGLGIADGNTILLDGNVAGVPVTQGSYTVVAASSTYADLVNLTNSSLNITNASATEVDGSTGGLRINGDGGLNNELSGMNIRIQGGSAANFDAVFGVGSGNYVEEQGAADVVHDMAITIFDPLGSQHVLNLTFKKDPTVPNRWNWEASLPAPAILTSGSTGAVTFDDHGRLESFTYDGGGASLQFNPNPGASVPVDVAIDAGSIGDIDGLSQFGSPANAVASSQDGFGMGNLQEFSIDEGGVITGFFTNGVNQTLGRIAVAAFANPTGLIRRGDNMYEESANSGGAVIGFVGTTNGSTITPGAIEGSNVDLSQEFTSMIIAQRGFQANARVITTADEMLTELVNLKR